MTAFWVRHHGSPNTTSHPGQQLQCRPTADRDCWRYWDFISKPLNVFVTTWLRNNVLCVGLPRYSMVFPKQSKEWVAKKIYEPTSQYFTQHLVKLVLERREERTPEDIPHVQRPANIATKERPPKEDLIRKHQSRFPRHTDAWKTKDPDGKFVYVRIRITFITPYCTVGYTRAKLLGLVPQHTHSCKKKYIK